LTAALVIIFVGVVFNFKNHSARCAPFPVIVWRIFVVVVVCFFASASWARHINLQNLAKPSRNLIHKPTPIWPLRRLMFVGNVTRI